MNLETEVTLIPISDLNEAEIDELVRILNEDQELRKWLYNDPEGIPATTCDEFIHISNQWMQRNHAQTWCIYTDRPVGEISLSHQTTEHKACIGYWLASQEWQKGIASEAFRQVIEKARGLGFNDLSATVDQKNIASLRLWSRYNALQEPVAPGKLRLRIQYQEKHNDEQT